MGSSFRRGLLLTYVGESTNDIFDILPDTGTTYQAAIDALTQHFTPQGNNDMAIFDFHEIKQGVNETLNKYYRRLKTKAAQCNFHSKEAEIKTQIIHKTRDSRLRKKALRDTMTLKEILDYRNTLERTDEQSKRLDNASKVQSKNTVNYNDKQSKHTRKSATSDGATSGSSRNRYPKQDKEIPSETPNRNRKSQTCRNCGGKFPHKNGMESCPTRGKQCHNCQKMGHFAKYCKSPPKPKGKVQSVTDNKTDLDESDNEYLFTVNTSSGNHPETQVEIGHTKVNILIDSGASVNLLNHDIYQHIQQNDNRIKLFKTNARIFTYGTSTPLNLAGEFIAIVTSASGTSITSKSYVTQSKSKCILGYKSSSSLGRITLKVNKKLAEMRDEGIIEKVVGGTPWLSPLIAIPKKLGDLRLVFDMCVPNTALVRRRVQISTVNEILQTMEGAKVFTEVDLSQGYLQLTLAEESRYITAFSTPEDGPHRFKRLIMGASPCGEHFQRLSISSSNIYQIAKIFQITFGCGLKIERHTSSR